MEYLLKEVFDFVPLVQDVTFRKGTVLVFDTEKYLRVEQGTSLHLPLKVGQAIPQGSTSHEVIRTGTRVVQEMDNSLLGVSYFSAGYPIIENGKVVGGIVAAVPTEFAHVGETLKSLAEQLLLSMQEMSSAINQIATVAQELAEDSRLADENASMVKAHANKTNDILRYINSVAESTKLLGINASIESARAGKLGAGFAIVAGEIQKLATTSLDSSKEIKGIVGGIQSLIDKMADNITHITLSTQTQAAATQEITASIETLTDSAQHIAAMAQKL